MPILSSAYHKDTNTLVPNCLPSSSSLVFHMASLNSVLVITLLVLVCYSSFLDARKILKMETQEVPSLQGTLPSSGTYHVSGTGRLIAGLANDERVLVESNPSPGAGHY